MTNNKEITRFQNQYGGLGATENCAGFFIQYNRDASCAYIHCSHDDTHIIVEGARKNEALTFAASMIVCKIAEERIFTGIRPFSEESPPKWHSFIDDNDEIQMIAVQPFEAHYDLRGLLKEGEHFEFIDVGENWKLEEEVK